MIHIQNKKKTQNNFVLHNIDDRCYLIIIVAFIISISSITTVVYFEYYGHGKE